MTKAAYIRNSLLWANSSLPGGESLNIMVAGMEQEERHGTGTAAESLHIDPEAESREPAENSLDF